LQTINLLYLIWRKPKNVQFKISFDMMDERDLKFNF
jgi:hypothetical protein